MNRAAFGSGPGVGRDGMTVSGGHSRDCGDHRAGWQPIRSVQGEPAPLRGLHFRVARGVDECASFTTKTMAEMLSELRKYRVGLVLAGQYLSAIKPPIRDAIFGNVGNLSIFRIGATDAPALAKQLGNIDPESFINLSNYLMFKKIMIQGNQTKAFSAQSRPDAVISYDL